MRVIKIEKLTLNIGSGASTEKLEKGSRLIKSITGREPVKTFTTKRIPAWNVRPGLALGCKLTVRKKEAGELLVRLLRARDNKLSERQFDGLGNIAFGLHDYMDIPGVKYDPAIGIMGLEVCITLERPGFRVKRRKFRKAQISIKHAITKEEAVEFMKKEFNASVV
ncbi:50S ribosomal protein L5 [Candidatus Woesearchaeota archaeon]|nr:50S ribosomal protein L5 [Candidatus Woesearchaeota archaeon]